MNYFQWDGQSLADGAISGPLLSTTQPFKGYMAGTGSTGPLFSGSGATVLQPLVEVSDGGGGGQTQCTDSMAQLSYLCLLHEGFVPTVGAMTSGQGGRSLAQLIAAQVAGGENNACQPAAVSRLAQSSLGISTVVRALLFDHGEADSGAGSTSIAGYASNLLSTYYETWAATLAGQTGTDSRPPIFITQLASEGVYAGVSAMAAAQTAMALANPGKVFLIGPQYCLQQNYTAGQHLLAPGYRWSAMLAGAALFRALRLRQRFTGLLPRSLVRYGSTIYVHFSVPRPLFSTAAPSLVIDTASIQPSTLGGSMYGFEVHTAAGAIVPISSVTLAPDADGNLTVAKIVCAIDPGAGGSVGYGYTFSAPSGGSPAGNTQGGWGNLRDNDSCPALYPTVQGASLWNWCPLFLLPYIS
jgi:hypothetical protein